MYINMKSHKLSIRLVSCILGFFLLIQSIYIPVYAAENPNVSEPNLVTLIDAKNTSGNPRTLRIEFIAPVRFADNNPSVIILASGSSNPDADGDIQQTFLVESENSCIAVDAEMIAGYSYASQYNLTFENNLGRTGVVHITGDSSDGKESCKVTVINTYTPFSGFFFRQGDVFVIHRRQFFRICRIFRIFFRQCIL